MTCSYLLQIRPAGADRCAAAEKNRAANRARLVAGFGDLGYEALPAEDLADVSFDYATGMMARAECGDLISLPLPAGTVLPARPDCIPESDNLTRRGIEWLKDLLN